MPETEDRVWVPLDELEKYLQGISTTLMGIIGNVDVTIEKMKESVEEQKGETNDDN